MAQRKVTTAAGVVAVDDSGDEARVLLVHRPHYDDWSLPKGKVHADEYLPACAARETLEETAVAVRLGVPLGVIRYPVGGGLKQVHYWRATALSAETRTADDEVDKVVWLPARVALARMSYGDERAMVDRALDAAATTPFLIVRHGKAMERKHWSGRDQARPINDRGRRQSRALVPLLAAYGVDRIDSSSSVRCVQTLKPYAKASGLEVQGWSTLSEELAQDNEKAVLKLMKRMVVDAAGSDRATAVCGHRPVLPAMLGALGVPARPMQPAATAVAHLDADGRSVALEWHKPKL